ncbi:phage terminase large subunit family protein [Pseudomonas sp. ES1]|uniref:phage terminase large subunit family protein n=1 Tax=Pseudomonas sp. ES1 TaxID=3424775 RepID=UPI003D326A6E
MRRPAAAHPAGARRAAQGDSIKLAKERLKTFRRSKIIIGGTPTIKGLSAIDAELELSDKRVGLVPCHG